VGSLRVRRPGLAGDDRADRFRALFDATHHDVLAYALRRTASPADAADVLADTMLVAWRRLDEVPSGEAARPWLYGVARHVLANHRRGSGRRDRLRERLGTQVQDAVADGTQPVADGLWARAALARLGEEDREVLTLTAWEGLAPAEVAVVLGLPAVTVRTRLHRARARLRVELEASAGERSEPSGQVGHDGPPPVRDNEEVR
jgi:RNA polymerase sigma factor (sigma-70 family)